MRDGDDYFYIDQHINQSGSIFGFRNGDVDLNGFIDGDDYFYIDQQINNQNLGAFPPSSAPFAQVAAVPEPASVVACAFASSVALLSRRRRAGDSRRGACS